MTNKLKEELGKQEEGQIRSNIERIISSYRHVWDIYTELLQNSADAIIEKFGEDNINQGKINLEIDPSNRTIIIKDNGIGIKESEISKILVTGKSLKRERNSGKFGFMGFGFTFVAFQSNYLKIESICDGIKASRTYNNLYEFIYKGSEIPNSEEEIKKIEGQNVEEDNGTKIIVRFPSSFPDETVEEALSATFRIAKSEATINAVLRTRTIVGLLNSIFENKQCFQFTLKVNNQPININTGYLTTREIVKTVIQNDKRFYDRPSKYEELINITEDLPRTDQDTARKAIVLDEKIEHIEIGVRNPIQARVFISATSKSHISQFNNDVIKNGDDIFSDFQIEHGLWLSIGGMPIGVCLDPFNHSNYLPYTVIVDIKNISIRQELDAGRKGISSYRMKQISEKIFQLLKEKNFIKYRRYIVGGATDSRISNPLYEPKQELMKKINVKTYFASKLTQRYFPPIEEQEVISLFTELTANGKLKGYFLKVLSGYQVYDGLYEYDLPESNEVEYSDINPLGIHKNVFNRYGEILKKDILIEFKIDIKSLFSDIDNNKKDVSHIDILVCWTVDFNEKEKLQKDRGYILMKKDVTTNVFYGVTHQITGLRQQPLPIIELKKVLELVFNYFEN